MKTKSITQWAKEIHQLARAKGWYDNDNGDRNFGELIALVHSELSEALEVFRANFQPPLYISDEGKPEGVGVELADAVIRIFDMCQYLDIDIEKCIKVKHEYNKTRPYRHGNKAC